jgi:tubulin polyglutamylase TTLL6/13
MFTLHRKNNLGKHLMRMNKHFPQLFQFFPKTWLLPADNSEFLKQFNQKFNKTFILKPEASCQGRGIFLVRRPCDVPVGEQYVAQRYMAKPYLIDGLKFDLRIYVLIAGVDPLRIYMYKEGL